LHTWKNSLSESLLLISLFFESQPLCTISNRHCLTLSCGLANNARSTRFYRVVTIVPARGSHFSLRSSVNNQKLFDAQASFVLSIGLSLPATSAHRRIRNRNTRTLYRAGFGNVPGAAQSFIQTRFTVNVSGTEKGTVVSLAENPRIDFDSAVSLSDGTSGKTGGSVEKVDEAVADRDGSVIQPDGLVTKSDGSVGNSDGGVINCDGSVRKMTAVPERVTAASLIATAAS
jgi:hypothetical protein